MADWGPPEMTLDVHMIDLIFSTGTFMAAWSWALVYYAVAHLIAGESPMMKQIGFGGHNREKPLPVLLALYLLVCCIAVGIAESIRKSKSWLTDAAISTVEFFPSPIFNATLLAYLSRFSGGFQLAFLDVVITWSLALAVYLAPIRGQSNIGVIGDMVRNTVGFGLGLAWNFLVSRTMPPESNFVGLTIYLLVMIMVAAHLAAPIVREDSCRSRQAALMSFASRVVVAFTLTTWTSVALSFYGGLQGWLNNVCSLLVLLLIATFASVLIARADIDGAAKSLRSKIPSEGFARRRMDWLIFVPCFWCCCPWIPLVWLFGGGRPGPGIKARWLSLIKDVCSLASSVVGTNIITGAVDSASAALGLCSPEQCDGLLFVLLEVVVAATTTLTLLPFVTELRSTVTHRDGDHFAKAAAKKAIDRDIFLRTTHQIAAHRDNMFGCLLEPREHGGPLLDRVHQPPCLIMSLSLP
eukprot:CAMPEP_0206580150 /NCGR_PEP_ID=MMETSP0325_2-20121206/32979_1 /ASSEMBLY_ACC=CAM_ASM_000347 /TAXON_ID=2866 /ORGANISM="Crypthecodinium cohnii, Strain Seligo" /LENGTH=466 /DNA_ID=CAMNT_0054086109 /DNA_START=128 /DNA_END=1529 /DNA_ORIENTATION=-